MKIYRRRAYIMTLLTLSLVIPGESAAQSNEDSRRGMSQTDSASSGVHDFDFCICLGGKGRRCLLNLQRTVQS